MSESVKQAAASADDDGRGDIADLQTRIAFQEETIERLDEALANQQREILLLQRQVELLHARHEAYVAQQEHDTGEAAGAAHSLEKPPHY